MKTHWLSMGLLAFLSSVSLLPAEELKVGYIDSGRILEQYMGTGELVTRFDEEVATWRETATKMKSDIDALLGELRSQELMLSEEAKAKKREEIAQKEQEYQRFVQEVWGPEGKAVRRRDELTKPVVEKIDKVLERLASQEGYAIIFDVAEGSVVYAEEKLDLTDLVLAELNKEYIPATVRREKAKFIVFKLEETTREASELKLGQRVSSLLKTILPMTGELEAVEDWKVTDELKKEGIEKAEEVDLNLAYRIAQRVEGEVVIRGRVGKLGEKIDVEVEMADVSTERKIATEPGSCTGEQKLDAMVRTLVEKLIEKWRL